MTIVIIGAGIAGVSVIDGLLQEFNPSEAQFRKIILISTSRIFKKITNYKVSGRSLETFDVIEQPLDKLEHPNLDENIEFSFIVGNVKYIDSTKKILQYTNEDNEEILLPYNRICICNGASPRRLDYKCIASREEIEEKIFFIRDTDTVKNFRSKLSKCRRLVIVGNGGIGLELVSRITNCEKIWIVKDSFVGATFLDSGGSKFFLDVLNTSSDIAPCNPQVSKISYSDYKTGISSSLGPSMGPDWAQGLEFSGENRSASASLKVIYNDEVADINLTNFHEFPLVIRTKSGSTVYCDMIAVAIGVEPNSMTLVDNRLDTNPKDGGIYIDNQMRTSVSYIYAAGDCVSCEKWPQIDDKLWFQMRLWTQARQMGHYAGQCIASHISSQDPTIYSNFDCFTHCTSFFGYKVILLGRFNGQFLSDEETSRCEVLASVSPSSNYVKILLLDGRIIGSVLVGESGLEETIENLIHDRIDVSAYKYQLLDNTVDIDDYFD